MHLESSRPGKAYCKTRGGTEVLTNYHKDTEEGIDQLNTTILGLCLYVISRLTYIP